MTNKNTWTETDSDCCQYVHYFDEILGPTGTLFEFVQITGLPNGQYGISHAVIDIECYEQKDILDALNLYGYKSMDDFVQEISPYKIKKKKDGTLDPESEHYIIDNEQIAEMLFEIGAFESLLDNVVFDTFEDAEQYLTKFFV